MVDSTTFVPQRKLITDPGYIPASPFIATDASRNYNRWNAYWLQPRGTLGPFQVGLHGTDNPGVGALAACCDSCAKGGPCTGCLNGIAAGRYLTTGMFTPGMGGIIESMQEKTDGYAIPVILGTALGYLAERKSGAVLGAVAGAGLKWVYSTYLNPFVAPLLPVAPTGVSGFRDDFALNPAMTDADTALDRSAFRFLQLILIVGATTFAVKVGKGLMKPKKANRRRRNGQTAQWKALKALYVWAVRGDRTGNPYSKPVVRAAIQALGDPRGYEFTALRPRGKINGALYDLAKWATQGNREGNPYTKPAVRAANLALGGDGYSLPGEADYHR